MSTDLNAPLGQDRPPRKKTPRHGGPHGRLLSPGRLSTGLAIVAIAAGSAYAALRTDRIGQGVIVPPELSTASVPDAAPPAAASQAQPAGIGFVLQSGTSGAQIETAMTDEGATVNKITPLTRSTSGPALISVGKPVGQDPRLAHLPAPALTENSKYGPLPKRGADGARPMDVYARPWSGSGGIRIAVVVGGLGLSQTGTLKAIEDLPDGITLGFASAGNSLGRWMQRARQAGHEIVLQVPFEPFDYPNVDPGPRTLTVAGGKDKALDDLHYAMGRITNYTGVMNFMGARFLSDPTASEPVMRDLARRGVMFLDDGSSARTLTATLAPALGLAYAKADLQLDQTVDKAEIAKKLDELEAIARRNGTAIGVAAAFDESIDAIAAWANEVQGRGIELVGVSALANDPEKGQVSAQ